MALLPFLPPIAGESLTSYLNRIASFHCDLSLSEFLRFFGISQQDAMLPTRETITRVSKLTGASPTDLERMTALKLGNRVRSIGGEVVHPNFFHHNARPLCPLCLLSYQVADSPSSGQHIGRAEWQIKSVRVCKRHNVLLQQQKCTRYHDRFAQLPEFLSDPAALAQMATAVEYQRPSDLQKYISDRIHGISGSVWLDAQQMDLVAQACEMLGVVLLYGSHVNLDHVTNGEWADAGHIGFGFNSRGEEGLLEALCEIYDRHVQRKQSGGPQKAFGRLYQWIQFNTGTKPRGEIRRVFREFILDRFPLEVGSNLFGEPVTKQRVHSVWTLAKKFPFHSKTIQHAAEVSGLVEPLESGLNVTEVFDYEAGEKLLQKMVDSMPMSGLPSYLNCNRVQAEKLVRSDVIPRIFPKSQVKYGILTNVSIAAADRFLNRFMGKAEHVNQASKGMMDIVRASQITHVSVLDTIDGILGGKLKKVEILDPNLKFKGVLVDPTEIRAVLAAPTIEGFIWKAEAAELIGIPVDVLTRLSKLRKASGDPYFNVHWAEVDGWCPKRMFCLNEVQAFRQEHILVSEYAMRLNVSVPSASAFLRKKQVETIAPLRVVGRRIYRRADLIFE
jgi:hypothetical protein